MATPRDDGVTEIQLSGKQLVFLFMAGTVAAVVIFLLGVFVGRGVRAQAVEADPLVADQQQEAPEIPPIAAVTGGGAPGAAAEGLSYPERLTGEAPPREPLGDTRTNSSAESSAEPAQSPGRTGSIEPASQPADPPATGSSTPERSSTGTDALAADVPGEPGGSGFAIQLAALARREEAENMVRRLTAKGYPAYLLAPEPGAPAVYRVRVGKFRDRREAEAVSARLQKEEQFKPWIVR
jgi:cell division septation protein DedD